MRYRVKVARLQIAERTIRAVDEEDAVRKIQAELDKPYGFLGTWETVGTDIDITPVDPSRAVSPEVPAGGSMLLSVKDAAALLGISRSAMYGLLNSGEIDSLELGRRRLISRDTLLAFVEAQAKRGD